jgi:hypothetical protein
MDTPDALGMETIERETYIITGFAIKPSLRKEVVTYAKAHERSFSSVVREALIEYMENHKRETKHV